ncbi:MAG: hypothetical protein Q9167_003596 [Letrouitia subvulpina]
MVLGYGNFTGLSSTTYKAKLREADLEKLRREEIRKYRNRIASMWSVASGFGWAYFTFGGSIIVSGIGSRKWRVSQRKLEMIREELARRDERIHKAELKDILIPLFACAVGTGVGVGMDIGIASLLNPSDIAMLGSGGTSGGNTGQEIQAMLDYPTEVAHGIGEGAIAQPDLVAHGGSGSSVADLLGMSPSNAPAQLIDFDTTEINDQLAELVGAQVGVEASTTVERAAGQITAQELTWWITERLEDPMWLQNAAATLGCRRYLGTIAIDCNGCQRKITQGRYWRKLPPIRRIRHWH